MLPLPKGDSTYTQAKKAEYNRDLERAVRLYMQAIEENDRKESAIKDVAGLLNQMGCAVQAIDFLEKHKLDLLNTHTYENLRKSLLEQLEPHTREDLPRTLDCFFLNKENSLNGLNKINIVACSKLFKNHFRINRIFVRDDGSALVEFFTHTAAKKALDCQQDNPCLSIRWAPREVLNEQRMPKVGAGGGIGPIVCQLPAHCLGPKDLEFFHLLPTALWRELNFDSLRRPPRFAPSNQGFLPRLPDATQATHEYCARPRKNKMPPSSTYPTTRTLGPSRCSDFQSMHQRLPFASVHPNLIR